jgi:hypothetical protein
MVIEASERVRMVIEASEGQGHAVGRPLGVVSGRTLGAFDAACLVRQTVCTRMWMSRVSLLSDAGCE